MRYQVFLRKRLFWRQANLKWKAELIFKNLPSVWRCQQEYKLGFCWNGDVVCLLRCFFFLSQKISVFVGSPVSSITTFWDLLSLLFAHTLEISEVFVMQQLIPVSHIRAAVVSSPQRSAQTIPEVIHGYLPSFVCSAWHSLNWYVSFLLPLQVFHQCPAIRFGQCWGTC